MGRKNGRRVEYWVEHLRRAAEAPDGVRKYCERSGIGRQAFYYWKKRLAGDGAPRAAAAAFSKVEVVSPAELAVPLGRMPNPQWLAEFLLALSAGSAR
jgi:hypothetical protein